MSSVVHNPRGILFVSMGNTCRSAMAAALFAKSGAQVENGIARIVRSAGIRGVEGQHADDLAQEQMYRCGIDLSGHRARNATATLLAIYDLILVMEEEDKQWLETMLPGIHVRTHLLGRWRGLEIADPGHGRTEVERAMLEIEKCLSDWRDHLRQSPDLAPLRSAGMQPESKSGRS